MDNKEITEVELVIARTNQVQVPDVLHKALVGLLVPIATRLPEYVEKAETAIVQTKADAEGLAALRGNIAQDIKAIKDDDVMSKMIAGLHSVHRQWTTVRSMFTTPLEEASRIAKGKIIAWQEAEAEAAENERLRLQAVEDERARKEREKLEARAEKVKSPEKQEALREQAATVTPTTVHVEAPKTATRTQKRWKVQSVDMSVFLAAAAQNTMLHGLIEIKQSNIERMKSANPSMEIPGVAIKQVVI